MKIFENGLFKTLSRLKEKGILGELQAFLRMKMVEKLQGTELTATRHAQFSNKDDAINKIIYDYLKYHHMYYTMSVFASECSTHLQPNSLDKLGVSRDILSSLGIRCDDLLSTSKLHETSCILNWIVDTLENLSNKKSKSKSSQYDLEMNLCKLMLNSQSQTDPFPISINTQSVQTTPAKKQAETQTDEQITSVHRISADLNEEILELKNKLEKSQIALKLCQTKLQDTEDKLECLLVNRNERFLAEENTLVTQSRPAKYITRNQTFCQKRLQEAFRFINHLDGRLQFLDQKYQKVAGIDPVYDSSRLLSDQNLSPFS